MNTVVIYHRADYDGLFSRAIAERVLGASAEYIGWDYGDPLPAIRPEVNLIYMIDISVDGMMDDPRITWIDHHKSAIDKFSAGIPGLRIDGVAACRLAWQWFQDAIKAQGIPKEDYVERRVTEPLAVRLAGEYDVWDKRDDRTDTFQAGLRSVVHKFPDPKWEEMLSMRRLSISEIEALRDVGHEYMIEPDGSTPPAVFWQALENGRLLLRVKQEENDGIIKQFGFKVVMEGLTFLACNAARYNSLLFTAGVLPEHDALLGFNYDGKGKWRISPYHAPGKEHHDLSLIAAKYGGGGHRGACGFKTDKLPFLL